MHENRGLKASVKAGLRKVLPYPVIKNSRRALYLGLRQCPICSARVRRFLDSGFGYPVLEEQQVVGGLRRRADLCPVCHSAARHRLVGFYLDRHVFGAGRRETINVLHIAPERALVPYVATAPGVRYRAGDLEPERYRHIAVVEEMNLLDLPVADGEIDLLLCNHVLEHIPDDAKAMAEIRRVLAPEGRAILQVPLSMKLPTTREGTGSETPAEKIRLFGQSNHVRIYAANDYVERLRKAGLDVERYDPFAEDAQAATRAILDPFERLHVCRRAEASPTAEA